MSVPTQGETYAKLMEHLRKAQEECSTLGHLRGLSDAPAAARGWMIIGEQLKLMQRMVTKIAMGKMQ